MNRVFLLLILPAFFLISCNGVALYDSNMDIRNELWNIDSTANFKISVSDTLSVFNIYLNLRNTSSYPNSNLYLFIHTTSPGGASLRDTMECILADKRGRWLGKGFGKIRDNQLPYKRNIRFPEQGIYSINIQHGMRTNNLQGISSVGIRVEKAEKR